MSLSDLASIGLFISGIAVLISLIFLFFQLKQLNAQVTQAEKYQQALVKQARASRVMEVNARLEDESFAKLNSRIVANANDLTLTDLTRFFAHARTVFQNGEDTFSQYRRGLLEESDFVGFSLALKWTLQAPSLRVAWDRHRLSYPPAYVEFVDRLVREAPIAQNTSDTLTRWKSDLASQLAKSAEALIT